MHNCLLFTLLIFINLNPVFTKARAMEKDPFEIADSLTDVKQYAAARQVLEKAWLGFKEQNQQENMAKSFKGILYTLMSEDKYQEMIEYGHQALKDIDLQQINDPGMIAAAYQYLAYAYLQFDDFDLALTNYKKVIDLLQETTRYHSRLASCYLGAAQIYLRRIDYTKAKSYLYIALEKDIEKRYQANIYSQLANCHYWMGEYTEAMEKCKEGLPLTQKPYLLAAFYSTSSRIHFERQEWQQAEITALKVLELLMQNPNSYENRIRTYSLLGQIAAKKKDYNKAENYFSKGLAELRTPGITKNRESARLYVEQGEFFMDQGKINQALTNYQKAYDQLIPGFDTTNILHNPNLKEVYPEAWLMTISLKKAAALSLRYKQQHKIEDLQLAQKCYKLAFVVKEELRNTYGTETSKLLLSNDGRDAIEAAIDNCYHLYQITKNQRYLDDLFALMEASRATILNEAIQKNKAILLADIPEELIDQEKSLRNSIANNRIDQINRKLDAQPDSNQLVKLENELVEKESQHHALIQKIKNTYPRFDDFYKETEIPDIAILQHNHLSDKTAILSFFVGKRSLYTLLIEQKSSTVFQSVKVGELEEKIDQYLKIIRSRSAFTNAPSASTQLAYDIFQQLGLEKLLARKNLEYLIFLPDAFLNALPIDALMVKAPQGNFDKNNFLLQHYNTQYLPSINLFQPGVATSRTPGKFVKINPGFADTSRGLWPLKYSQKETASLKGMIGFSGKEATAATFGEWAPQSYVLHLSTHASADSSLTPRIELEDRSYLLPEIYALDLSSDLVVLSACETNLGKLERGEGVLSLARGFFYAGAKSLISSQWKVNEEATAKILDGFYREIKKRETKSVALRKAKLNFLEKIESGDLQSPYYWAGLTYMGMDGTLDLDVGLAKANWFWILGVLLFVLWLLNRVNFRKA